MDSKQQGAALKAWRKKLGLTLEAAAERIALEAEQREIPPEARSVPRTHVSLRRWEEGLNKDYKLTGLEVIAGAYGVETFDLLSAPISAPPEEGEREPSRQVMQVASSRDRLKIRRGKAT